MSYRPKPEEEIRRNMSAIRSRENETESRLRKTLFARGFRYRKYCPSIPGSPDFAFIREKVAVFVDGDFWHARILREKGPDALEARLRTQNRDYWWKKLNRRVQRDDEVTEALEEEGWAVLRLWESDVKADLSAATNLVEELVRSRRP